MTGPHTDTNNLSHSYRQNPEYQDKNHTHTHTLRDNKQIHTESQSVTTRNQTSDHPAVRQGDSPSFLLVAFDYFQKKKVFRCLAVTPD